MPIPPSDDDHPVSRRDLGLTIDATSAVFRAEIAKLREEMAELRSEVRGEIAKLREEMAELRSEVRGEIAEQREEMAAGFTRQIRLMLAVNGVTFAILAALIERN